MSRLIFGNAESQVEFRGLNGYSAFLREFVHNLSSMLHDADNMGPHDDATWLAERRQHELIIDDVFSLFFVVCLDGRPDRRIGNLDMLVREVFFCSVYPSLCLTKYGCLGISLQRGR
jgi:hypothetical protein